MNRDWHIAHPMPPRATEAQRIAWHREHAATCACRPIPARLRERMRELGIEAPDRRDDDPRGTGPQRP